MSRWTETDAWAVRGRSGCAPSGQVTNLRAAAVREGIRLALGAGAAALLLAGWAGNARATVDGIEFICPCELELRPATGEASVTFGARNFRPTVTGALSVAFSVEHASGATTEFPGRELVLGPLAPDAESRRFTRRWPGLSRFVEADASDPALAHGLLALGETEADGGLRSVDRVPLLRQDGGVSEDAIVFRSPDFLTDGDGDGVADANERLEGTDPADPRSAPGESTLDVLVLHNEGYASKFGYAPHTRIHHLMTLASLAYEHSGTNIRLRTVGIVSMEDEDGDWDDDEDWNTAPTVELLERAGRLHGADINVYFRGFPPEDSNFGPGGGFANLGGHRSRGYMTPPARARFDAAIFYPVSAFVVAHEIGHVLGLDHPMQWGTVSGTFRWARGHTGQNALTTIMGNGGVGRFSDPDADCSASGCPYGAPRHEWNGADAVASLDAVRFQVARFREAIPDADGDNIVDPADRFPLDAAEWRDTDGDGIGNRADPDDDNDAVPDGDDRFPLDPMEWADVDNDGIGDNADPELPSEDMLIPDPALRAIIEEKLGLPPGAPIAAGDMASIDDIQMPWNELPSGERVRSLEGLQHAVSLHTLTLRHGDVSDLSPLSGLERLGWLDLSFNLIADVSPLVGMPGLRSVVLGGNAIADISPLAGMNQLEWLELHRNYLDDASLEWLGGLTGLHRLNLSNQQGAITDIAPLADLRRLEHLELSDNPRLYDIGTISNFPELRTLSLNYMPVSDISALAGLTRLSRLHLSGTQVKNLDALTGLPELSDLFFWQNSVSDMAMFSKLRSLSALSINYNQISDISALVDSPVLADDAGLWIQGNPLGREAIYSHVPLLEARGIAVHLYDDDIAPAERHVPDGRLRAALAEAAGKPGNADDVVLFDNDFRYHIRWLDLSGLGIEDLTGLEHASRLISVNLARNPIEDLSPLLGLASLRHVTLDAATLNGASLQRDIDALRARGVAVTSAETGQGMATAEECRPGLLLAPGEDCVYPGTEERFTVDAGGMATFLFGAFGESVEIVGRIGGTDYDLAASRRDGGVWRIDRVAGNTDAPADDRTGSGGSTVDSSPSFAGACFPTEIWYRDGTAIDPLTLPLAAGGNGPLTYSLVVFGASEAFWELTPRPSLVPGLAFDPAERRIAGTPMTGDDENQPYGLEYIAADADGDTDSFRFQIVIMPANSSHTEHGTTFGNPCETSSGDGDASGDDASSDGGADAPGHFDLDDDMLGPAGITFANGRFHIVDFAGGKVYAHTASGQRDAAADFDLDDENRDAGGIAFVNGRFHVTDWIDDKVYAYSASGQRDAAADFDLDDDNDRSIRIAFANGRFYVVDWIDNKVYAYLASGQRDAAADFDLDDDNSLPLGITFADGRFHVVDNDRAVYAYMASGQRDASADFNLDDDDSYPQGGIAFANGRFHVVDFTDSRVYSYSGDEGSAPGNAGGAGQSTAFEAGETLADLPSGVWTPDVTSGGSFTSSGGAVTVDLDNGGYIEEGDYRYTCRSGDGCRIEDRRVTSGSIVRTSAGDGAPPSFVAACYASEIWYRDGAAIDPLTLPPAAGGDAPLTYSFEVIGAPEEFWELDPRPALIPGLAFDPATRRVEGAPINDTDWIQSYGLRYAVTDADGDTDELEFDIYLLPANSTYRTHGAMYDDSCDGFLTDAFTDSTGRTIRFSLQFGADWDLGRPRGVELYFHGNETGTEMDMLDAYKYFRPDSFSLDKGMLRAAVASPYSAKAGSIIGSSLNNDGRRGWLPEDARLIHELLQSDFGGNAAIDRDRIVFTGDSQGPCFINYFLQRYAGVYGGGFHSDCGCLYWGSAWPPNFVNPWSPTVSWTPHAVSAVAPRFKVFVQSTTGDFLHDNSVAMRDLFRDVLGFETRWDLDAPGGHCAAGATPYGTIFEWLSDTAPAPRILGSVSGDHDVDGLADAIDPDDDNDGAPDIVDARPLEPRGWLDTDSDGIGDFLDRDADGDGVENASDPFPLDPLEWADNDGDGIGDNIDLDDDNDGIPDTGDPRPLHGPRNGQLTFGHVPGGGLEPRDGFVAPKLAGLHASRPATVVYPEAIGHRQTYHAIRLGDGEDPVFEFMVDTYETNGRCEDVILPRLCASRHEGGFGEFHEERLHVIWVDRNRNRDLTDDGPPSVMADRALDRNVFSATDDSMRLGTNLVLKVPYGTGELLPYRLALRVVDDRYSNDLRLVYNVGGFWIGRVPVPGAEPVLVGTFDANLDGVFNTGTFRAEAAIRYVRSESGAVSARVIDSAALDGLRDYACVDLDRDGELNDCGQVIALKEEDELAPMYPGEPFTLDGRTCTIETAPTGHTARIECQ